ncbi:MAG: HlyC/CorC family transporter [Gaiellales bacterium]|nr:HlyC/CorC family transporter [Gaiellales bacterium]
MSTALGVLLIVLLIVVNGVFVAAEFAIVKVRPTRIIEMAEAGSRIARISLPILDKVESYLPVIQLGVTMATLGLGWASEPVLSKLISDPLDWLGISSPELRTTVAAVLSFVLATGFTIVLGELVPKSIAIRKAEGATLVLAVPLRFFYWLFWPIVWVLNSLTKGILALLRVKPATAADLAHSEDELRMILSASAEGGHIDEVEQTIMRRALTLGEVTVGEVMVPRTEMAALSANTPVSEALDEVALSNHTRYPVFEDDLDDTIGYVHVKDLYRADRVRTVRSVLRQVGFISETASVELALARFQSARTPLAIVVDEHGGTSGLVTVQDVVEQLIGEVQDEFDHEAPLVEAFSDGTYSVDGGARLEYLEEALGLTLTEPGFPTLGGRVFEQLQRRPRAGDEVVLGNYQVRILEVDGMRVARVLMSPVSEVKANGTPGSEDAS